MKKLILLITLLALTAQANDFAFKLYNQLSETEGNLFFSPASIEAALAMTREGAAENTLRQMNLLFPEAKPFPTLGKSVTLENANALWIGKTFPILGNFQSAVTENHDAEIHSANFSGQPEVERLNINAWVEEKTRDRIQNLMPAGSVNNMTRLALVNAIYFKGDWLNAFDKTKTVHALFRGLEKETLVPMMTMKPDRFGYFENDEFQCVELPYKGEEVSMRIYLPSEEVSLSLLEQRISVIHSEPLRKEKVKIHLPRFKTESTFDLNSTLIELGLTDAFDPQQADFSGITGARDLFIAAAIHKAFVQVNEEGTEAAAATGITMGVTCMPMPPKIFRADHPFVFLIHENASGKILFMGRITNPSK